MENFLEIKSFTDFFTLSIVFCFVVGPIDYFLNVMWLKCEKVGDFFSDCNKSQYEVLWNSIENVFYIQQQYIVIYNWKI